MTAIFNKSALITLGLAALLLIACRQDTPAHLPDIPATVEAQVQEALAAVPTPAPLPTYTPYPPLISAPTYTPYPTPTPAPATIRYLTPRPAPTYTPYPTLALAPTYTPFPTLAPLPTYTPYPTPIPAPTATPTVAPTATPEPTATPVPLPPVAEIREFMLGLINENRQANGLEPVTLGDNRAAQYHAEAMRDNGFLSHWGMDGLAPYMRFTLASGSDYSWETVSGYSPAPPDGTTTSWKIDLALQQQSLMDSPNDRENILFKWHKKVNLGIACTADHYCRMVKQFQGDYIEYFEEPDIREGILTFNARWKGGISFEEIQVWYDPEPRPLTLGQLDATYGCCARVPVTFLLPPPRRGREYSRNALRPVEYSWAAAVDPHSVDPATPRTGKETRLLEQRTSQVPITVAEVLKKSGGQLEVEADLTEIIKETGPGVYTVVIRGTANNEPLAVTNYSVFNVH